jgi:hypothetical protein
MADKTQPVMVKGVKITNYIVIPAKYDGTCEHTRQPYKVGTPILYKGKNFLSDEEAQGLYGGRGRWDLKAIWAEVQDNDPCDRDAAVVPPKRKSKADFEPSEYQDKIRTALLRATKNILISALAGCGKTATLVWLCWELKKLGLLVNREVYFLAFNANIRDEVIPDLKGSDVTPLTTHQFCNRKVLGYKIERLEKTKGDRNRRLFLKVVKDLLNVQDDWEAKRSGYWRFRRVVLKLVPLIKNWAILPQFDGNGWVFDGAAREQVRNLFNIYKFEIERENPEGFKDSCIDLACSLISYSLPAPGITPNEYDFDDMLFHVLVFEVPIPYVDMVFVDEVQDLSAVQIRILSKMESAGTRIVAVGDKNQAIYMFRGAYARAWDTLNAMLAGSRRGLDVCELPINYRSEPEILDYAMELVPGLIAFKPRTGKGKVCTDTTFDDMMEFFRTENSKPSPRNMCVICRTRAPLIQAGYAAIGQGQVVCFLGKGDFTKPLHEMINEVAGFRDNPKVNRIHDRRDDRDGSVLEQGFLTLLRAYVMGEKAKYEGQEDKADFLEELTDTAECLRVIAEYVKEDSVEVIRREIDSRFVEKPIPGSITFTTGHGSKGLQWKVVFGIRPDLMPHPSVKPFNADGTPSDEFQQEMNLKYIFRTRPEEEIHVVCTWPFGKGMADVENDRPSKAEQDYPDVWAVPEAAPKYDDRLFAVPEAVNHPVASPPQGWGVRSGGPLYPIPPIENRPAAPVRREKKFFQDDGEPF